MMFQDAVIKTDRAGIFSLKPREVMVRFYNLQAGHINGNAKVIEFLDNAMNKECPLYAKCMIMKDGLGYKYAACLNNCPQNANPDSEVIRQVAEAVPNVGAVSRLMMSGVLTNMTLSSQEIVKDFSEKTVGSANLEMDVALMKNLEENGVEFRHPDGVYLAMIPVKLIDPNKGQPRTNFDKAKIRMLAKTLKSANSKYAKNRSPIAVTQRFKPEENEFRFLLEDGERRWRGAKKAGTKKIFCMVIPECDDIELLVHSCLANHCRENLDLWDSARSFTVIMKEMGWTVEETAETVGLHPGTVYNALKLLKLHPVLQGEMDIQILEPGVALRFNSYPIEDQPKMLEECRKRNILSRIKKSNPKNFARKLKKVASDLRVQIVTTNHGKRALSLEETILRAVARKTKHLADELEEMQCLEAKNVQTTKKINVSEVLDGLLAVEQETKRSIIFLKKIIA